MSDAREQLLARRPPQLEPSENIEALPLACSNEVAAVEFIEKLRWGACPACVQCGGEAVYRMTDTKTGARNKRFLWRCPHCKRMFTVRIGTVFEYSRLGLRHWCYAFWRASTSATGVTAPEITRQCRISYRSALFLLDRLRYVMAPPNDADGTRIRRDLVVIAADDVTGVTRPPRPGPVPETLKLKGNWQANIAKALQKKRLPGGRPKSRGHAAATGGFGVIPTDRRRTGGADSPERANLKALL